MWYSTAGRRQAEGRQGICTGTYAKAGKGKRQAVEGWHRQHKGKRYRHICVACKAGKVAEHRGHSTERRRGQRGKRQQAEEGRHKKGRQGTGKACRQVQEHVVDRWQAYKKAGAAAGETEGREEAAAGTARQGIGQRARSAAAGRYRQERHKRQGTAGKGGVG